MTYIGKQWVHMTERPLWVWLDLGLSVFAYPVTVLPLHWLPPELKLRLSHLSSYNSHRASGWSLPHPTLNPTSSTQGILWPEQPAYLELRGLLMSPELGRPRSFLEETETCHLRWKEAAGQQAGGKCPLQGGQGGDRTT